MDYFKIADYARFKGQTKQAIYKSKKVRKTKLEDGSIVIMAADMPQSEVEAVKLFLSTNPYNSGTTVDTELNNVATVEINGLNAKIAELESMVSTLRTELNDANSQIDYLNQGIVLKDTMIELKNQLIEELKATNKLHEELIVSLTKQCDQAQILLAQKLPDRTGLRKLLPWFGKK